MLLGITVRIMAENAVIETKEGKGVKRREDSGFWNCKRRNFYNDDLQRVRSFLVEQNAIHSSRQMAAQP